MGIGWLEARLLGAAMVLALIGACAEPPASGVSADGIVGSTTIPLDSPLVRSLGRLEGPYRLDEVLQPRVVRLVRENALESFVVLGLRNAPYQPAEAVAASGESRRREELVRMGNFKMEQLTALCAERPLYLIRMGEADERNPPAVYLFGVEADLADPAAPTGSAELINALALRRGIANMELDGPLHPFHELMLECQQTALAEARRETVPAEESLSIWNRFSMHPPTELVAPGGS